MTGERSRRLAAVMFTDVVGYTAMMQEDEEATRVVRLRHREALEAAISAHGGELVQYLGDGSLSTFPSTVGAAAAATEVQRALRDEVPLRIGIHQGEIAFDAQGIYGDSVNVAARVMGLGTPGSVVVSDKAQAELVNQRDFGTASLGQFPLKNVKRTPTVYALTAEGLAVPNRSALLAGLGSTPLYEGVTEHWPKIAGGLLAVAALLGLAMGGDFAAGVSFQSYVFAWAAGTAATWFLFDKAELAMSQESRGRVTAWLRQADFDAALGSLPSQFLVLFDRVFGERHFSWRCFGRSAVASMVTVWIVCLLWAVRHPPPSLVAGGQLFLGLTLMGLIFNLIPDYVSLLETRYLLEGLQSSRRVWMVVSLDFVATALLGLAAPVFVFLLFNDGTTAEILSLVWRTLAGEEIVTLALPSDATYSLPLGLFFYSTFFTSAWLWLYAVSVGISRVMIRMNSGVGFLLRVTDIDRQPFRSLGFVSVIIASGLFALGLPFVIT